MRRNAGDIASNMVYVASNKKQFGNLTALALYNLYEAYLEATKDLGEDTMYDKAVGKCLQVMLNEERRLVA